jgi:formylglycine-generating enzyme required for sulfatase activity
VIGEDWTAVDAGEVAEFFYVGSPDTEAGHADDERLHEVVLTRDFAILSREVTQGDFESIMGYQPSHEFAHHGPNYPVQMVSWHEAAAYCNALSDLHGVEQCYSCSGSEAGVECEPRIEPPNGCQGYRLPTEAEWEYAARADDERATYNGDLEEGELDECSTPVSTLEDIAWYCGTAGYEPQEAGQKEPNGLGLVDMLGNVEEWVHDWYGEYTEQELATDPHGPAGGSERAVRGGYFNSPGRDVRAAARSQAPPEERSENRGFRPARTLEEE